LPSEGPDTYVLEKEEPVTVDVNQLLPKKVKHITVKKYLHNPHLIVKATHNQLKERDIDRYKRLEPFGDGFLDISVSENNLKRALRIMDAIICELERQDFNIETEYNYKRSNLYVSIGKVELYLRIREKSYRVTNEPDESGEYSWEHPKFEYFPDGDLRLEIATMHSGKPEKVIRDKKNKTLESQLENFFPYLLQVAQERKMHIDKLEARYRRWEKQRELNRQANKQIREERERFLALEKSAENFTKSQYIYDFIAEIKKQQSQLDLNEKEELKFKAWIIWAQNHADRLNPVKQMVKEIMDHTEKPPN